MNDGVVTRFLERMVAHDWDAVSDCITDDIVRTGPFGDTYTGRRAYLEFVSNLMPTLQGYSMEIDRVLSGQGWAVAELSETVELDGTPVRTPEALVFELDGDDRISAIRIYIQRP